MNKEILQTIVLKNKRSLTSLIKLPNCNLKMVKVLIGNGIKPRNIDFVTACKFGKLDIVKHLTENHNLYDEDGFCFAAINGHIKTIQYLIESNNNKSLLNRMLGYAAKNGHLEIVKYLVEKGATHLDDALESASQKGYLEIVQYLIEKGATKLNWALRSASYNSHLEVVKYLIEKGITDLDLIFPIFNKKKEFRLFLYLEKNKIKTIKDLNKVFLFFAGLRNSNNIHIIKHLDKKNVISEEIRNRAFGVACEKGNLEIAKFIFSKINVPNFGYSYKRRRLIKNALRKVIFLQKERIYTNNKEEIIKYLINLI